MIDIWSGIINYYGKSFLRRVIILGQFFDGVVEFSEVAVTDHVSGLAAVGKGENFHPRGSSSGPKATSSDLFTQRELRHAIGNDIRASLPAAVINIRETKRLASCSIIPVKPQGQHHIAATITIETYEIRQVHYKFAEILRECLQNEELGEMRQ